MHFHLPKPLHGWREFAGEVGIIVLGVLIALGFEQVVSWVHDRASAAATRASIRAEIEYNLRVMIHRKQTETCMQRRMREIAAFLDSASSQNGASRPSWIGAPYAPLVQNSRFKSAQSAGKFFLLPQDEQQQLTIFYTDGDDFNVANTREWYDWAQLRSLTSPATRLTDTELSRLRSALEDARAADWLVRLDLTQFMRSAQEAGMVARTSEAATNQIASVCLPIDMPFAKAAALAGTNIVPFPE